MAPVNASVMLEGEQMVVVSGQEKVVLPPTDKGSQKEDGLWERRSGTKTGHPSLAGIEDQMGESNQEKQNSHPIYYQDQVTTWGCVTATKRQAQRSPRSKN